VLNTLLRGVRLGALAVDWLGSAHWVVPSIGAVVIWQQLGFGVVVFTAALLALPSEVTEAALLDGATPWQAQRLILIPQIRNIIEFFVVLEAITVLSQIFNYVYVLTGGGPGNASTTLGFATYVTSFVSTDIGRGNAWAYTIALLTLAIAVVYMRLLYGRGDIRT
jgi:ABC-type sugar transport system permease subunit